MTTVLLGLLAVGLPTLLALGGFALVHRRVEAATRRRSNEVGGILYTIVGVAYSVLLTFVLTVVWQQYSGASLVAEQEADALLTLYHLAEGDPVPQQRQVQATIVAYLTTVVAEEWPLLATGQASSKAQALVESLRVAIRAAPPTQTPAEAAQYAESLRQLDAFADYRRQRLHASRDDLPSILWVVLVCGGIVAVTFTYLFGMEDGRVHALMVGLIALTLSGMLLTIRLLDNPFAGDSRIEPTALRQALRTVASAASANAAGPLVVIPTSPDA